MSITDKGEGRFMDVSEVGVTLGLEAFWKLNGDAADYSGNGHHMTPLGPIISSGLKDLAYDFDGSNDYMTHGSDLVLSEESWTVSYWFNSDSISTLQAIFSAAGHTANSNWINILSSKLALWDHNTATWHYGNTTLSTGVWYNAMLTYNGSGQYEYFLNGISDSSFPVMATTLDSLTIKNIGVYNDQTSRFFNGRLTNIRAYNRSLSNEEIMVLYKYGLTNTGMQIASNGTLYVNKEIKEGL
jgi:hypothetical protein